MPATSLHPQQVNVALMERLAVFQETNDNNVAQAEDELRGMHAALVATQESQQAAEAAAEEAHQMLLDQRRESARVGAAVRLPFERYKEDAVVYFVLPTSLDLTPAALLPAPDAGGTVRGRSREGEVDPAFGRRGEAEAKRRALCARRRALLPRAATQVLPPPTGSRCFAGIQ